eukprot:CAMPEP_0172508382 /NCGR_PEP_ID=MMETSP1066-20121228/211567_1 /TAXON_ID=671091 /ORGANISM="Coscinodiscus wailesii, Strain CCMP2513" /LENGTH=125 /DNA_ID=CAMNT_0013286341 /DNA_START=525 /DNA_END=902 /DNA_ORIENTATION=-
MEKVKNYLQTFPYAAVLPVQPLQYRPTERGVDVTFLRKKTKEKGSMDGGIVITVVESTANECFSEEGEEEGKKLLLCLTVQRNATGQTVPKMFSEKIVVTEMLKRFDQNQDDLGVRVESVFHRWM